MSRPAICCYLLWIAGGLWAFMLGLAAPNPDGPLSVQSCLALLAFTFVLQLTLCIWLSIRRNA